MQQQHLNEGKYYFNLHLDSILFQIIGFPQEISFRDFLKLCYRSYCALVLLDHYKLCTKYALN